MNGPFITKEASQIISNFLMKELFPEIKNIRSTTLKAIERDSGLINSLSRKKLNKVYEQYVVHMTKAIKLHNKWNDLDVLYKDMPKNIQNDSQQMGLRIQDWHNMKPAVDAHFNEAFMLLDQTNKALTNRSNASYTRITILISCLAAIASALAIWATFAADRQ